MDHSKIIDTFETYQYPDDSYIDVNDEFIRQYMDCEASKDPDALRKLLEKHAVKNHFTPDPEFATSPICIKDDDFDFSVDLSLIPNVESEPFLGTENDDAIEHMNKLASLSSLFSNDKKIHR